jgi:ribosomal protein S18 acetylase RimI-like enzyme
VEVRAAVPADLPELGRLFDAYRVFYRQPSDPPAAERFLRERFARGDSHVFVAPAGAGLAGFVQLYPSLSSVSMARIFVLNDLFVDPSARRGGVGRALLEAAHAFARSQGAVRVSLETAVDNHAAQRLYESLGYARDAAFHRYHWRISPPAGVT